MSIGKNKLVDFIDMASSSINLNANVSANHRTIVDLFNKINILYGESSVSEDIVLSGFLSIYNAAQSITSNNKNNVVIETFLSKDYFDQNFPLDKKLNIDIQNGDLTLPIISTKNIPVSSIIIENESNGYISDMTGTNNIQSILSGDSSALFRYEKVANSLSMSDLYLTLTLKTNQIDIANELYIQLYADNNTEYPIIDMVEYSEDGEIWNSVNYTYDTNKADHYIRFAPEYTGYVRVRFIQSTYTDIQTGFGVRYNYLIGIRQITLKKTLFDISGEYITIPLQSNKPISSVSFSAIDNGPISYFISANNGTKLVPINSGDNIEIYNNRFGVRDDIDITSMRIKILMDKTDISINNILTREYSSVNGAGKYYVSHIPEDIKMFIGKHISYGDLYAYTLMPKDITKVDNSILEVDSGVYGTVTLNYVPYYDGIVNDLMITSNGAKVKNDRTIYDIVPHQSSKHSVLQIKNPALTSNSNTLRLFYNMITSTSQKITLPAKSFTKTNDGFIIVKDDGANKIELGIDDFIVNEDNTGMSISINDSAYSKLCSYYISYCPQVDISDSLPSNIKSNEILTQTIVNVPQSQLCFEYKYKDISDKYKEQYYTQICNQFRIELK